MHIVFLSHEYPIWASGGVGTFLQTFCRVLVKNGHKATIVGVGISEKEEMIDDMGVTLYRLPVSKSILPNFINNRKQLNKKLKIINNESPIDIIESSELGLALINVLPQVKKVIRLHGGHHFFAEAEQRGINWKKGFLEKQSFKKADGFIAVSNYVKEHTNKFLSFHNKPIKIINYPVCGFEGNNKKVEVHKNKILFAGTVCQKKGVNELLQAFKIVREKFPEMVLDIYGRDWFYKDGSSYIEGLKNEFNKTFFENVTFRGVVSREELNKHYNRATVCVFPSHMETQGLVCLEAMLLGKPVVFSKFGPGSETIQHKETGLLCDVYNPKHIAEMICWYLENLEKAKQIGINASKRIKEVYNTTSILKKNIEFYSSLL